MDPDPVGSKTRLLLAQSHKERFMSDPKIIVRVNALIDEIARRCPYLVSMDRGLLARSMTTALTEGANLPDRIRALDRYGTVIARRAAAECESLIGFVGEYGLALTIVNWIDIEAGVALDDVSFDASLNGDVCYFHQQGSRLQLTTSGILTGHRADYLGRIEDQILWADNSQVTGHFPLSRQWPFMRQLIIASIHRRFATWSELCDALKLRDTRWSRRQLVQVKKRADRQMSAIRVQIVSVYGKGYAFAPKE